MRILVTGAKGFVGSNLCDRLHRLNYQVFEYDKDNNADELERFVFDCDFIVHLAGINRPTSPEEFKGNSTFTELVISCVKKSKKIIPILMTSSIQAELNNEYGKSKKEAENALFSFQKACKNPVYVLRCPNLFGKWCKPNYNSVIATFCYNVSHNIEINVNEEAPKIPFLYIDDLINQIVTYLNKNDICEKLIDCSPINYATPKEVAELLYGFKNSRNNLTIPNQNDFEMKLYATYLSYLDENDFAYDLHTHSDDRGSFTELFKTNERGQTSINIIKPGITKGNHYHNTKNEKFIVVNGSCEIKFRKIGTDKVITYSVAGDKFQVVDIPTGYTHSIKNVGTNDAHVIMWASECFDPENPDTYFEEV